MTTPTRAGAGAPAVKFKLDLPGQRRRHVDGDRYTVWVLWIIGYSAGTIGNVVGLRRRQVTGLIEKSDYRNRAAMTDKERLAFLKELQDFRCEDGSPLDGGRLNNVPWELLPLEDGRKRRPARAQRVATS